MFLEIIERIDRRKIEDLERIIRNEYLKKLMILIKPDKRKEGIEISNDKFGMTIRFMNQKYRIYFYYDNENIELVDLLKINGSRNKISLFLVLFERYIIEDKMDEYHQIIDSYKKEFKNWLYFDQLLIFTEYNEREIIKIVREQAYREKREKFLHLIIENEMRIEEKERDEEYHKKKEIEEKENLKTIKEKMIVVGFNKDDVEKWDNNISQWVDYIDESWDEITGYNFRDYIEWYKAGFSAQETYYFKTIRMKIEEAIGWKNLGITDDYTLQKWKEFNQTPEDVKKWNHIGYNNPGFLFGGAQFFLEAGMTPEEVTDMKMKNMNLEEYIKRKDK